MTSLMGNSNNAKFSEDGLYRWLNDEFSPVPPVQHGIGDDAAVLQFSQQSVFLLCSDTITEGTHFRSPSDNHQAIGRKAAAVTLSDIAAMGGNPVTLLTNICYPEDQFSEEKIKSLFEGMKSVIRQFDCSISGGDTVESGEHLTLSTSALGTCPEEPILRGEARPGESLFVSGALGGSFPHRHLNFTPKIELGRILAKQEYASSLIDISDGLIIDLHRLLNPPRSETSERPQTGAVLSTPEIPIHPDLKKENLNPSREIERALTDGEDFELLFTVPEGKKTELQSNTSDPITEIGTIREQEGIYLEQADGTVTKRSPAGYQHFQQHRQE